MMVVCARLAQNRSVSVTHVMALLSCIVWRVW